MGQAQSLADTVIPDTVDVLQMELVRHTKVLSEINSLSYGDFKACLDNLNQLSRKCIDPSGKQLVFLVKRGTDSSVFWKATVKIACVKVDPNTRHIENYKFLNLKQFLCVFKTFQEHLTSLETSENQRNSRRGSQENNASASDNDITASILMERMNALVDGGDGEVVDEPAKTSNGAGDTSDLSSPTSVCSHANHIDECSICLDGCTEVILPCAHGFCTPCIEQWNVNNKTCPICCQTLNSVDDTWVISDVPGIEEINEEICAEFMRLAKKE